MRRRNFAILGIVVAAGLVFFLAPAIVTGYSCGATQACISKLGYPNNPSKAIYSSPGCVVIGFGDTYWEGSFYWSCSPPIPITN